MQLAAMPCTPLARRMADFGWCGDPPAGQAKDARPEVPAQCQMPQGTRPEALQAPLAPQALATPLREVRQEANAAVATYASRDSQGRVWGVPNAGGRGQCLDCPRKAKLPSTRCAECQLRRSQGQPMADVSALREAFDRLLQRQPGRQAQIQVRLDALYTQLQGGQISDALQDQLRFIGSAEPKQAQAKLQEMIAEHWQQHKYWLSGLKWLVVAPEH
ncbi:unnamed protein product [Effrenium voratum]|nr:unnamed protein product [Effrenium voratum]|mmetsp:Transcript_136318/g.322934  ORF Transcript_136318/g.322934 Transcript_136318/m.322934 type:complete len:217 (-) Transcript_136318:117-767(-)